MTVPATDTSLSTVSPTPASPLFRIAFTAFAQAGQSSKGIEYGTTTLTVSISLLVPHLTHFAVVRACIDQPQDRHVIRVKPWLSCMSDHCLLSVHQTNLKECNQVAKYLFQNCQTYFRCRCFETYQQAAHLSHLPSK